MGLWFGIGTLSSFGCPQPPRPRPYGLKTNFSVLKNSLRRLQMVPAESPYQGLEGNIGDHGKESGNYYSYIIFSGYIGIMEKKMETTIIM